MHQSPYHYQGMTLGRAALVAGLTYLVLSCSPYAEYQYGKLVVSGHVDQTMRNITSHGGQFGAVICCYLLNFVGDLIMAWSLFVLLAPVNQALARLMAWLQLMYAAVGFAAVLHLVVVFNLLHTPAYRVAFGATQLPAQVQLLLSSFRSDYSVSLLLFGLHLVLLGWLVYHAGYIPKLIGPLLVVNGLGWVINGIQPYLFPQVPLDYLPVTFFGELVFMFWLLLRGWKIREPIPASAA